MCREMKIAWVTVDTYFSTRQRGQEEGDLKNHIPKLFQVYINSKGVYCWVMGRRVWVWWARKFETHKLKVRTD